MKKLTLMTLTLLGAFSIATAYGDEKVKSFPAGGAADILEPAQPELPPVGGAIVKKADCRLNTGRVIRAEDPDYAKCLEMKGAGKAKPLEKKAKKGEQ